MLFARILRPAARSLDAAHNPRLTPETHLASFADSPKASWATSSQQREFQVFPADVHGIGDAVSTVASLESQLGAQLTPIHLVVGLSELNVFGMRYVCVSVAKVDVGDL